MSQAHSHILTNDQSTLLQAFSSALSVDAHVLIQRPDLLWQQFYNRLQWEHGLGEALLAREFGRRSTAGMPAWMRQRVRSDESSALIKTFAGHTDEVFAAGISPDGRFVVSAGHDNTLRVWDSHTGLLRLIIPGSKHRYQDRGHTHWFSACALSPDGGWLVAAGSEPTLKVYDAGSGVELLALRGHHKTVLCCAVSQDGKWILSGGEDEILHGWNAKTGTLQHTLVGHRGTIHSCAFSPDGRWGLSGAADHTLILWDLARGKAKTTLKGHQGTVYACAFSPDGEYILSGGDDQTLILWQRSGFKKMVRTFAGHTGRIKSCAFSPDGKYILSAGADKTLRIWDPHHETQLGQVVAHNADVTSCAFSPDGRAILSAGQDASLKFWDLGAVLQGQVSQGGVGTLVSLSLSPGGKFMLATEPGGVLKVRDPLEGSTTRTLSTPSEAVEAIAISPDQRLAASCSRGELKIWDTASWERIHTIPKVYARRCTFSPDSRVVIAAQWPDLLRAWAIETGQQFRAMQVPTGFDEGAWDIDLSPDGRYLLYANSFSQKTARFEIRTGELLYHRLAHDHGLTKACYSPDGRWFLTASRDHTLKIWGPDNVTLIGHTAGVSDCAISPDGRWAASAGQDGTLKVWDTPAGIERLTLDGHTKAVRTCAISPDGSWILSVGDDYLLKIWEADSGREAAAAYIANLKFACFHPLRPAILTLDAGGHYQALDLENIHYGALIVTAADRGAGSELRCPQCWQLALLDASWLGHEITCPQPACTGRLLVNPFVTVWV